MFRWPQMKSRAGVGFFNVPDVSECLQLTTRVFLNRVEGHHLALDRGRDWPTGETPTDTLARLATVPAVPMPSWVREDLQVFESSATSAVRVRPAAETLQRLVEDAQLRTVRDQFGRAYLLAPAHAEILARGTGVGVAALKEPERLRYEVLQGQMLLGAWQQMGGKGGKVAAANAAVASMAGTLGALAAAGLPLRPPSGKFQAPSPTAQAATFGAAIDPDDDRASRATMMTMEAPPGYELVTGKTFPVKDQLKALGARWSPENKGWFVPTHHADEARMLVRKGASGAAPTAQTYPCWECGVAYTPEEYAARHGNLTEWWCGCGVVAPPRKHRPNFGR